MSKHPWFADEEALDWSLVASKRNQIVGTFGDDRLAGTDGADDFQAYQGGTDRLRGLGGDDRFYMGNDLDLTDRIDGGDGFDNVNIGNPAGPTPHLVITDKMLVGIEKITMAGSQAFDIELKDGLADLKIKSNEGGALELDASAMATGAVSVNCRGGHADEIVGSQRDDVIYASLDADILTGEGGSDKFLYKSNFDSSSLFGIDEITDFSSRDVIKLSGELSEIDFHIGRTESRIGDVLFSYSSEGNRTTVSIFVDSDDQEDMTLYLDGRIDLQVTHGSDLVVA